MTTVEVFEKVGEIEIPNLRPAQESFNKSEAERARKEELAKIAKEREEQRIANLFIPTLKALCNGVDKCVREGENSYRVDIYCESDKKRSPNGISAREYEKIHDKLKEAFKSYGYSYSADYWSRSTTYKSGRAIEIRIGWEQKK